jgi:hypothetical protein
MKWMLLVLGAAVVLLLFADFLAFHDLFEPHRGTDWLMLAATVLTLAVLAAESIARLRAADRS